MGIVQNGTTLIQIIALFVIIVAFSAFGVRGSDEFRKTITVMDFIAYSTELESPEFTSSRTPE